jgi:chromate transporter
MRLLLVERNRWIPEREFVQDWALSRLSPGIHLIALTGMLGQRIAGLRGLAVSVAAMVVPAGIITAAMTAAYGIVRDQPLVEAGLAGIAPVTLGLTGGTALALARAASRHGRRGLVDWGVLALATAAGLALPASPFAIIVAGAIVGALFLRSPRPDAPPESE